MQIGKRVTLHRQGPVVNSTSDNWQTAGGRTFGVVKPRKQDTVQCKIHLNIFIIVMLKIYIYIYIYIYMAFVYKHIFATHKTYYNIFVLVRCTCQS